MGAGIGALNLAMAAANTGVNVSGMNPSYPASLASHSVAGPGSPAKTFPTLPGQSLGQTSQQPQNFGSMQALTSQLQGNVDVHIAMF